jgi:orotate phosphoribosyltransferase
VNTLKVLTYVNLCDILAHELWRKLCDAGVTHADWVIGSDHAGAALAQSVAREFRARSDFAEKGPNDTQLWKRHPIESDAVLVQVEELMTTAKTLEAVHAGLVNAHEYPLRFAPVAAVLVDRSKVSEAAGMRIVHFVHYDINVWEPAECPLCAQGSPRIRPKGKENWARLTFR